MLNQRVQSFSLMQEKNSAKPGPSSQKKMRDLKSKKKSRAGHKGFLTQAFIEVDKCLGEYNEERKNELVQ